jgi:hypothetical protein
MILIFFSCGLDPHLTMTMTIFFSFLGFLIYHALYPGSFQGSVIFLRG